MSGLSFVEIGQARIEVLDIPASKPTAQFEAKTLVLLHEGLGCVAMWRDFPRKLAQATGARVVAYSRVGYGQSSPHAKGARHVLPADYMHREATDFLPLFLKTVGIERPLLVGHSDGGTIALIYAATHPRELRGLCVMAPHCFVEECSIASIEAAKTLFESSPDFAARLAKYHRDPAATFYGWNDVWLSATFRNLNLQPMLNAIDCPTLAIQGELDEYGTMRQIDVIGQAVVGARIWKIPNCGHAPWKDTAQPVIAEIATFSG